MDTSTPYTLPPKTIIVISDLRSLPIAAALSIKHKGKDAQLIISFETIFNQDYGQNDWLPYRLLKVLFLIFFAGLRIMRKPSKSFSNFQNFNRGILSSLYSITKDSLATPDKYPKLILRLLNLSSGAETLTEYIEAVSPSSLYIFNGRLASSYPIVRYFFEKESVNLYFYEYGKTKNSYQVLNFPPHNLKRRGVEILRAYLDNPDTSFSREKLESYIADKLSSRFTDFYKEASEKNYDIAIFLSSTHEYMSLDEEICEVNYASEVNFVEYVVKKYGSSKSYAVRCHPNQRVDPSWKKTLAPLAEFCEEHELDFFSPESGVSSYDLILHSNLIVVDLSSIGYDAIVLGKEVEIYGDTVYKPAFQYAKSIFLNVEDANKNQQDIVDFVTSVIVLGDLMFEEKLSDHANFLLLLSRSIEKLAPPFLRNSRE